MITMELLIKARTSRDLCRESLESLQEVARLTDGMTPEQVVKVDLMVRQAKKIMADLERVYEAAMDEFESNGLADQERKAS